MNAIGFLFFCEVIVSACVVVTNKNGSRTLMIDHEIKIYSNYLLLVEEKISFFENLTVGPLIISEPNISSIGISAFKNLRITELTLKLAHTKLELDKQSFRGLPFLETLIISSGVVQLKTHLFRKVGHLKTLLLTIDGTEEKLNIAIPELRNLRNLTVMNSHLVIIRTSTFSLYSPTLSYLDLTNNSIDVIEREAFSLLTNLKYLSLNSNNLKSFPPGIFDVLNLLENLSIASNKLGEVERHYFSELRNLRQLNLENNCIKLIEVNALYELKISYLSLANNKLERLQWGIFSYLRKLKILNLDDNRIHTIERGVFKNLDLELLSLRNNRITRISIGDFYGLSTGTLNLLNNTIQVIVDDAFRRTKIDLIQIDTNITFKGSSGILEDE